MSTINDFVATLTIETAEEARKAITKHVAALKKGEKPVKEEPAAIGGAGKPVVESKTPAKAKKDTKAETPSAPVKKGKKPVAKVAAAEEETPAAKPAEEEVKRKIVFGAKDSHTKTLKEVFGLPTEEKLSDEQTKLFNKLKPKCSSYLVGLSKADFDAKSLDDHVKHWHTIQNQAKAVEPVVPEVLSYEDLKGLTDLNETNTAGTYWDPSAGRHVTGPAASSEEGLDEIKDGYLVGETTKRVYNDAEVFLGFAGIGKFKDM
jgi:hypothetical protein